MPHTQAKLCPIAMAAILTVTACPLSMPGSDSDSGSSENTESGATATTDTDTGADTSECPAGIEGCPCSDAGTCFPGLTCFENVCDPANPCPIGSAGCPCTNGGTCDDGSICEDGVCQCTPGELGCACDAGACGDALDCIDGECVIPELISEAANGWGPVTCWSSPGAEPGGPDRGPETQCTAYRGDVGHRVYPACMLATKILDGKLMATMYWPDGFQQFDCVEPGVAVPVDEPWQDAGCWLNEQGYYNCYGRIGHLLIDVGPACSILPSEWAPWPMSPDNYGCVEGMPPSANDVDEWSCSDEGGCRARYGSLWTLPYPPCYATETLTNFYGYEAHDGWSAFACL
jgi:hypothetical protein